MPTYDYQCTSCKCEFEHFQSMSDKPLVKCTKCGKKTLKRLIGFGGGVLFKGTGFYETDYRTKTPSKESKSDSSSSGGAPKKENKKKDSKS